MSSDTEEFAARMSAKRSRLMKQPGELFVKSFPTSTMTSIMLETILLEREEELSQELGKPFHFDNVFIDYINIMCNWRNPNSETHI